MESLASSLKAERNCSNCSNNERGQHSPIDAIPIAHNHELIYLDNTQKDHDDCVNNINASSMPSHSKESLHELPSSSLTADVISTEASCASDMIVSENAPYEYCDNKHVDRHLHPLASPQLPPTNQCLLQKCATAATATTTATAATYSTTTATRSTTTQAHSAIVTTTTTTTVAIATTSKVVATTDGEAQQVGVVEQKVTPHSNNNTDGVLKSVSSPLFSKPQITTNSEHTTMTMASTISSSSLSDATSNAPTIEILPCKSSDSNNHFVTRNWKDKYDCIEPNYDDDDGTNDHLNDARCNNELLVHRDVDEERESAVVEVNDCVTENDIREVPRVAARRNSYNYPSSNEEVTIVPPSWSCSAVPACILYPDSGDNNDSKERSKRYPSSDGGGEDDESHISWFINVFPHHNVFELMSTSSTLDGEPMPCTHASFKRKEKEDSKLNPCNEDDGVLSKNEWSGDDDDDDDDDDGADADDKVNEESHAFSVLVTELSTLISSDRQEEQEVIFFDHNDNCNYNDANGNDFDYDDDDDDDDDDDHDNDDDGDDNGDDDDDKRKLHEAEQDTTIQQITGVEKEKEVAELDNEEPAAAHATENDNITDGNDGNENIVSTGDLFLMVTETLTTLPQMLCITPREQHLLIHEEVSDDIHEDNESDNKNAQQIPDEVPPLAISTKQKKFFGNDERPSVSCNESIELFSMVTDACSTPVSQMIGLASTGNCLPIREKSSDSTTYTLPWHEFQIPTMQSEAEESSSSNDNIIVKDNTIEVELSADSKSCDQQDTVLVVDAVVRALRKTKNTPKISKGNSATHELLAVDSGPPYLENFSDPPPPSPDAMNVLMSLTRMEWCGRKQNLVTIPELPGTESSVTIESVGEDDALVMRDACHQSTSESPSRDDTMGSDSFSIDGFPFKLSLEHAKDKPKQTDTMRLSRSKKSMVLMVPLRRENASDGNSITDTPFHELSSTVSASFEFVPSLSDDRIPSPPQNTKELIVASNMLCQESGAAEEYLSFSSSPPQTIFVLPTDGLPFQAKGLNNTIGSSRLIQDQHAIPSPNHQPPTKPSKKKSNISGHHLHLLPPLSPAPRTTPRAKDASPKIPSSGFFFSDRDARFDDTDTCSSISGNEVNVSLSLSLSDECPIPPSPKHTDPIFSPTTNSGGNTNTEGDSLSLSLSLSMSFSEDSDPISQSRSKRTPNDNALETDPNVLDVTTSLARKGRTKVVPHLAINETLRNTKSSLMKFGRSRPRARPGTPRFPFIIFPSITEEPSLGQMTEDSLRLGRKSFSSPSSSPSSYAYHNKVGYAETDDGFNEEQENQSSRARDGMHATEGPNNLRVSKRRPRSAVLTKGILKAERAYNDKKTTRVTSARRRSVHWDEKQLSTKVEKGIMCLPPRNKNKLSPRRPAYALQRLLHEITAVQDGYGKGLEMFSSFPQRPQGYIC